MSRLAGAQGLRSNGVVVQPKLRRYAAVASPHHAATQVGREVLADGGTAMDAAIAVNAMLGVVYPHMCGVGGDAFFLYYEARTGRVHALNGTGAAPALASCTAFAELGHETVPVRGPLSVTVPGVVGAWDQASRRFGSRALGSLLEPAIAAAEDGVDVSAKLASWIADGVAELGEDPTLARRFLAGDRTPLQASDRLRQPELARTLRRIADAGPQDFYRGDIAEELDRAMRDAGGFLRAGDLRSYTPRWVTPIRRRHHGLDIVTTPPNSQGITALLMLRELDAQTPDQSSPAAFLQAFVEAKTVAFALRDQYVTDPDHMAVAPEQLLTSVLEQPVAVASLPPGGDTVYFCTADANGNVCSAIQSIFYSFGSAFVAGETGVLLHNRGHHFSLEPDHPNRLGPGRRTLHTLMASLALERGRPRFAFGSMGADGQPQINVQVLDQLIRGATPQEAVSSPRVLHGRFLVEDDPNVLHIERDLDADTLDALQRSMPLINVVPPRDERMGHAHALAFQPDGVTLAGADPRSDGSAEVVA